MDELDDVIVIEPPTVPIPSKPAETTGQAPTPSAPSKLTVIPIPIDKDREALEVLKHCSDTADELEKILKAYGTECKYEVSAAIKVCLKNLSGLAQKCGLPFKSYNVLKEIEDEITGYEPYSSGGGYRGIHGNWHD